MLRSLEIRDVLIIDRLALAFQPGLNVLTGETGAGKSILLDALGFVLGWRGRSDLVRSGADQGEVVAVFDLSPGHPGRGVLEAAGIAVEDEVILRRVIGSDGRKTGFINDRRVSGEVLRDLSETLVELHGQHDDRGLLNPRGHRMLLDAYAGVDLGPVRAAWRAWSGARGALVEAEAAMERARAEEDFLRHAVGELGKLRPLAGEDAALDVRRRTMQAAERIRADVARAHGALADGAEGAVLDAQRWLDAAADRAEGRLDGALAALGRVLIELGEAVSGVEDCLKALAFNPADLEALEERLFAIRALARKYGVQPDDLGSHADGLRLRLDALDGGAKGLTTLRKTVTAAEAEYQRLAMGVSAALGASLTNAMIAISIVWWPWYARLVRGQALRLKQEAFVEAARASGGSGFHIMRTRFTFPVAIVALGCALGWLTAFGRMAVAQAFRAWQGKELGVSSSTAGGLRLRP